MHAHGGDDVTIFGQVGDDSLNSIPKGTFVVQRRFQLEDRGPDLLDDGLEIVERPIESLDNLG